MTNINTEHYWNEVYRREWERGVVGRPDYNRDYGPIHDAIIELVPDGVRVLDIGCGPGLLCRKVKLARPHARVTGIDFSAYAIAKDQARDADLGIVYRYLDVSALRSSLQAMFDVVTVCEVLEHVDQPERLIEDAIQLLTAGGRLVVTCPHDGDIPDPEHVSVWGHDTLFHLLARHSHTVCFRHFPPPDFHVWMMAWVTRRHSERVWVG